MWYAICVAANIDRQSMVGVVGEKGLCLLEEVAQNESEFWNITESLKKLEYRVEQEKR